MCVWGGGGVCEWWFNTVSATEAIFSARMGGGTGGMETE